MTTFCREGGLCLHTSGFQRLIESLTLAVGHHIILLAVEDDNRGIVGVDIVAGTQTDVLVWFLVEFRSQQHVLR